jgi:hypothetical protein
MKITNKMNLPEAMVKAVSTQRHNKPGELSATTILNGTKHILLTDRHWDELEDDVADRFNAIIGTAVHDLLQKYEGKDEFAEESISFELDGITVTGQIDNYNMREGLISDYKTAKVWKVKFNDYDDWRKQGLIYAWLLHKNGLEAKTCRFIAMLNDHSMREAQRDSSYPQKPMCVYEFQVTEENLAEIETYIKERIAIYKQYMELPDDEIPPCSDKERWSKESKYAVKKEGRKSAVRVFDTKDEADKLAADLGKGHSVEHRPGEQTKCLVYCLCKNFCNFYRENVADSEADWPKE